MQLAARWIVEDTAAWVSPIEIVGELTCGVRQFVLLALYPVLEGLGLSPGLLDAGLHRLRRHLV
jgi:hypothetical protein